MNTKTEQISSGLVEVAWLYYNESGYIKVDNLLPHTDDSVPVVRLSDAEAIISAKDEEIERVRRANLYCIDHFNALQEDFDKQAAEIERLNSECDWLAKAASKNYRDNGLSINGEFYKQAEMIEKQSAALKLAKEALESQVFTESTTVELKREALAAINEVLGG